MKRTQIIELFVNIKATWVSFASIALFVALGVGLYCGLCWTGQDIEAATDAAFDQGNLHAFEMTFPYGFSDDDIQAVRDADGVDDVQAGYASTQTAELDGKAYTAAVRSLTGGIDRLTVDEGELPRAGNEIAINTLFARAHGLSVGDTIVFASDADGDGGASDSDGMKYLAGARFKIAALVTSPAYLTENTSFYGMSATGGGIDFLAFAPEAAFDRGAFNDAYVTLEVSSRELKGVSVYSAEYREKSDQIKERIEAIGETRADARYGQVVAAAQAQIDDGQARLDAARAQIDEGARQLSAAQGEVDATTRTLEDAQLELDVTAKLLASQDGMTSEALDQVAAQVERYQQIYESARASVQEKLDRVNVLEGEAAAVSRFAATSRASLEKLSRTYDELAAQAGPDGAIDYDKLDAACGEYRAEMSEAGQALKRDAPQLYGQNKQAIDMLLELSQMMEPLTCELSIERISQALDVVDSVSRTADAAAQAARTAADDAAAQMDAAKASLDEARALYAAKRADYDAQMADAQGQVALGRAQVDEGREQLSDAQSQIDAKKGELASAQDEYDVGVAKLAQAKDQVSQIASMSWIVTPAYYNGAAQVTDEMVGILMRLRFSMASLFVIVGLLVCYSAVSRIVHEQIAQIGTKKAIGFRAREITLGYLAYTGVAVFIGAVLGIAVGACIVEPILIPTMNQCVIDDPAPLAGAADFLAVSGIDLALILLATWAACRGVLKRDAVELLQGERPPANRTRFYERWRAWRRLGLLTQTVVNNCVNDKRRVLGALVGVAGCTALIVSAVTLYDDVNASFDRQLSDLYAFDAVVCCDPDENAGGQAATGGDGKPTVGAYLDERGLSHTAVQRKTFALDQPDGQQSMACVYVPADPEAFGQLFRLNAYATSSGTGVLEGAWVSSSYANCFHAKVGDSLQLENAAGQRFDIPIAGFFESHSSTSTVVLSKSAYERIMGSDVAYNAYLVDARGLDGAQFQESLAAETADFASYGNEAATVKMLSAMFNNLSSTMVAIYIALSALMALIVLLNLNVMFIDEKKRELIVLMINGYSQRDARRYIYRDTVAMTAVGIVLGCILGCIMGYFSVASLESPSLCMLKSPSALACLAGAVLCALFSAAVTAIALRRISRFSLTDINRF